MPLGSQPQLLQRLAAAAADSTLAVADTGAEGSCRKWAEDSPAARRSKRRSQLTEATVQIGR